MRCRARSQRLELVVAGRPLPAGQAAVHLPEVGGRRPGHHQPHRRAVPAAAGSSSRRRARSRRWPPGPLAAGRRRSAPPAGLPSLAPGPPSPCRARPGRPACVAAGTCPRPTSREMWPSASSTARACRTEVRVAPRSAASWRSVGSRDPGPGRPAATRRGSARPAGVRRSAGWPGCPRLLLAIGSPLRAPWPRHHWRNQSYQSIPDCDLPGWLIYPVNTLDPLCIPTYAQPIRIATNQWPALARPAHRGSQHAMPGPGHRVIPVPPAHHPAIQITAPTKEIRHVRLATIATPDGTAAACPGPFRLRRRRRGHR